MGGLLVLIPGLLGYISGNLWLFPSLGPTIFQQVMLPHLKSSRFYSVLTGHLIGMLSGYFLVIISGAPYTMSAIGLGHLDLWQALASCVAVFLVILLQAPLRVIHTPAASTALLIILGGFKATWHDSSTILAGIIIVAIAGEIARRFIIRMEKEGLS